MDPRDEELSAGLSGLVDVRVVQAESELEAEVPTYMVMSPPRSVDVEPGAPSRAVFLTVAFEPVVRLLRRLAQEDANHRRHHRRASGESEPLAE
ncbi:hypothetical protein OIE50_36795 [Streptomyces canus]|uniref:hypothetical protein n=1 Tax=Streptomyces canus TaxID=58343 RepID=UPI003244C32F